MKKESAYFSTATVNSMRKYIKSNDFLLLKYLGDDIIDEEQAYIKPYNFGFKDDKIIITGYKVWHEKINEEDEAY